MASEGELLVEVVLGDRNKGRSQDAWEWQGTGVISKWNLLVGVVLGNRTKG